MSQDTKGFALVIRAFSLIGPAANVKALFRITAVWNVPVACNLASADFIISSPLMSMRYERLIPDYSKYRARPAVSTRSKAATERAVESLRERHNLGVHEMDEEELA